MSGIIQTPGLSGGRQGVMKEKIVDVKTIAQRIPETFDSEVKKYISDGYQPMPNSFTSAGGAYIILMIKSKMDVEMI